MSVISLSALVDERLPNAPKRAKFKTDGEISVGIWMRDEGVSGTIEIARKFKFNVRFRYYHSFGTPYFINGYEPELWDELCEKITTPMRKHYLAHGVGQGHHTLVYSGLHAKDDKFCERKFEKNSFCFIVWDLSAKEPVATHVGLLLPFGEYIIPLTRGTDGNIAFKGRGYFDFVAYETYFHFPESYRDVTPLVTEDNDVEFKAFLRQQMGLSDEQ